MIIDENTNLYHGSYMIVENPSISKCRDGKDFGRGFYLTTNREQAERFARNTLRKAIVNGTVRPNTDVCYVSKYMIKDMDGLEVYEFPDANAEWLHCVVAHRKIGSMSTEKSKWDNYDVMIGKIANDNTNLVITAYMEGAYGQIGSEKADKIAIDFLEPQNLKNQLCFRSDKSIARLNYLGSESIRLSL